MDNLLEKKSEAINIFKLSWKSLKSNFQQLYLMEDIMLDCCCVALYNVFLSERLRIYTNADKIEIYLGS